MDKLYSIRINKTGRYVSSCDTWYTTTEAPVAIFTREQALSAAKKLRQYYVYDVTLSNGTDTLHCTLDNKEGTTPVKQEIPVKKKNGVLKFKA